MAGPDDPQRDQTTEDGPSVVTKTRTERKLEKPKMYKVLLHNDDYTTMEFVVYILQSIFRRSEADAVQIMLHVHRNGVGVDGNQQLVFAITAKGERVNFWDFAGLFLKLGCRNALFLDGDISQMAVNPTQSVQSNQFGAMFIVAD